jgi:triphosphoribosyl-dephospho-CoA synthase
MKGQNLTPVERAQMAMMLEVCAFPKPGNVDRCHDYEDTRLEHFLASTILARPALEMAAGKTSGPGEIIHRAVALTNTHRGGNTHFGAFILLIPLIMGDGIEGARRLVAQTTVDDAVEFYRAFQATSVRVNPGDEIDVNDPGSIDELRRRGLTLYDVMLHSAPRDMVAREWANGFHLTRKAADLLKQFGCGQEAVVETFLFLLATEPDTFIIKKHGESVAKRTMEHALEVRSGLRDIYDLDEELIEQGINPGSIADIIIASIYIALGEGWEWDC